MKRYFQYLLLRKTGVEEIWNEIINQYNQNGYEITVD